MGCMYSQRVITLAERKEKCVSLSEFCWVFIVKWLYGSFISVCLVLSYCCSMTSLI